MAARKALTMQALEQRLGPDVKIGLSLATEILSSVKGYSPSVDVLSEIWDNTQEGMSVDSGDQ